MSEDGRGLFSWLSKVVRTIDHGYTQYPLMIWHGLKDKFGFCFVSDVPPTAEATEELVQRIGFIRETQCTYPLGYFSHSLLIFSLDGKFWEFTADNSKGDTAYTDIALGAHTDNTYFVEFRISLFAVRSLI